MAQFVVWNPYSVRPYWPNEHDQIVFEWVYPAISNDFNEFESAIVLRKDTYVFAIPKLHRSITTRGIYDTFPSPPYDIDTRCMTSERKL